jgi:hypothetical protein
MKIDSKGISLLLLPFGTITNKQRRRRRQSRDKRKTERERERGRGRKSSFSSPSSFFFFFCCCCCCEMKERQRRRSNATHSSDVLRLHDDENIFSRFSPFVLFFPSTKAGIFSIILQSYFCSLLLSPSSSTSSSSSSSPYSFCLAVFRAFFFGSFSTSFSHFSLSGTTTTTRRLALPSSRILHRRTIAFDVNQ